MVTKFSALSKESALLAQASDNNYTFRLLEEGDFYKGFLGALA